MLASGETCGVASSSPEWGTLGSVAGGWAAISWTDTNTAHNWEHGASDSTPQANQTHGCKPWYGVNPFTNGPWWNATTRQCPDGGQWFSNNTMPAPYGKNSAANPWRCVLTAPGMSTGQVGDDIAVTPCRATLVR